MSRVGDSLNWRGADVAGCAPFSDIEPSARVIGVPFTLWLPDGAQLQIAHDDMPADWFARSHRIERTVDRLERMRSIAIVSIVVVVLATIGLFEYVLPWTADRIASHMPHRAEVVMGRESLSVLRGRILLTSQLPADRRAHLQQIFDRFAHGVSGLPPVAIAFYNAPAIGANAFALPDGTVVFTDDLIKALPDDRSFLAVAAHELGHQAHHHMMREVLRSSGVVVIAGMLAGDVTSVGSLASAIPVFLLNSHYSRAFEADADNFAFQALAQQSIDPMAFVDAMRALEQAHHVSADSQADRYLSSHPLDSERIARAEAASRDFRRTQSERANTLARQ
ncbi:M48 family metallopeptidase [Dyella sp. 2HG41-7]|uniref:M48 family metallopeptidase n=1 Tax=Dyella sp. 2HG41-7 TaxID=2883239 RepID=UPI001F2CD76D